ncbi:uncharacterized protein LOC111664481 [Seriola lalandi dorsalis]|nr:uncharacterized protein LOC111664481 [Seriola lalandi dorsalis]
MLEVTVKPEDNITLYCDCKTSAGVYIVWYRNCSHVNQPSLVLRTKYPHEEMMDTFYSRDGLNPFPRFHLEKNRSSESYNLLIMNVTVSDEGLYYCGTEHAKVEEKEKLMQKFVYRYSNVTTRILLLDSSKTQQHCGVCWMLLFSLCPAVAVLSSLLSAMLVYLLCKRRAKEPQVDENRSDTGSHTRENQDEDVCYTALEIHQVSQRPKKNNTQSSDFSTYSAINTCRMSRAL